MIELMMLAASQQPYIDELMEDMEAPEQRGSYIEERRRKMSAPERPTESYIEQLKDEEPEVYQKEAQESFIERERKRMEPSKDESAIRSSLEGKELEPRKRGAIHHAFGFKTGISFNRSITAGADIERQSFSAVYGSGFAPDLHGFYEFQPFHSEWFGNFGLVFQGGLTFYRGDGNFQIELVNEKTGVSFGKTANTKFKFLVLPAEVGLNYRFNLARIVRPFIQVTGAVVGYHESRSDGEPALKGTSQAVVMAGGANILLDFLAPKASWELYAASNIKHYYLTVDFTKLTTIAGDVKFDFSGVSLGMTYEY